MHRGDKERSMDERMKEWVWNFKETLLNSSQNLFETDTPYVEDGGVSALKAAGAPVQRSLKMGENELEKLAPCGMTYNLKSGALSSQSADSSGLLDGTRSRKSKNLSFKSPSDQTMEPASSRAPLSRGRSSESSDGWGDYIESLSTATKGGLKLSSERSSHLDHQIRIPARTLPCTISASRTDKQSIRKCEEFRLPTPLLSESSCDQDDFEMIYSRVPPKEEAHLEKSSRIVSRTKENHFPEKPRREEESELSDRSSDSYVPKLLKIPPKRTSKNSMSLGGSCAHRRSAHRKSIKGKVRSPYSSGSSADTEEIDRLKHHTERPAWDHKSGPHRKVAPYLGVEVQNNQSSKVSHKDNNKSKCDRNLQGFSTLPLPKAGPSILKKSSLLKPPSCRSNENQSRTQVVDVSPVRRRSSFCQSSRTRSQLSDSLVRPAHVVTERLLKAAPESPVEELSASSGNKQPTQSRAAFNADEVSGNLSKKTSVAGVPEQEQTQNDPLEHQPVSLQLPKASTTRGQQITSPVEASGFAPESNQVHRTDSIAAPPLLKRASEIAADAFRRRSIIASELIEKKEPHSKLVKTVNNAVWEQDSLPLMSFVKPKKWEAMDSSQKRYFNVDIAQGINCIKYLKENAPGADQVKKVELVDLLVTPVEVKPAQKKAIVKVVKEDSSVDSTSIGGSLPASSQISSRTSVIQPGKFSRKVHDQSHRDDTPLIKTTFKTLDQIYKEVHGINELNTPRQYVDNDYEYELKKKQQLTKHKILR